MGLGLPITIYHDTDAYPFATEILSAVPDGLKVWILPGLSDIDLAARNFADGRKLSVVGSPSVAPHYTTGDARVNYFKSGLQETEDFTICVICRKDDTGIDNANRGIIAGSYGGTSLPGFLAFWSGPDTMRLQGYQDISGSVTAKIADLTVSTNVLKRYTFKVSAASLVAINETDGDTDTDAFTGARKLGQLPVNILSSNSGVILGSQGCYSFAMWDRVLTSGEINDHWDQMALHMARDGVAENT